MVDSKTEYFDKFLYEFEEKSDIPQCVLVTINFFYKKVKIIKKMYFPVSLKIDSSNYKKFTNFILNSQMKDGSLIKYCDDYCRNSKGMTPSIFDVYGHDITQQYLIKNPNVFKKQ